MEAALALKEKISWSNAKNKISIFLIIGTRVLKLANHTLKTQRSKFQRMAGLKNYSGWIIDIILKHCYFFFFLDSKENYIKKKNSIMTGSFHCINQKNKIK